MSKDPGRLLWCPNVRKEPEGPNRRLDPEGYGGQSSLMHSPRHSARGGHSSEPLQRTRVTHHLPPEILWKQSTEVDMGSTLPFQEAQVADLLPLPTQPSGPTEPVGPTAPGPTGPGPGPQNLEALKVPLEEAKALRVNTVDSAEESTELANFLGFMGASMDSTSFQKDVSQVRDWLGVSSSRDA
ncbi:unnamed protein product [Cladocopium goreaui]|uniref:Uncharacterized protein n=1 Tax=Cladocopium goreaui TaxID=2562237 RepID=A0A9P1DMD7_9DINO|nr:unnamed protein product [Cladocopium goreaui]